jgi:hypothetical protein
MSTRDIVFSAHDQKLCRFHKSSLIDYGSKPPRQLVEAAQITGVMRIRKRGIGVSASICPNSRPLLE